MSRLLLHTCCAPCACHVSGLLRQQGYAVDLFYYNPNIEPEEEYFRRLAELERFCEQTGLRLIAEVPDRDVWRQDLSGLEELGERSPRCKACFEHRLKRTAQRAVAGEYDYFGTVMSVSPHKNARWLNEIGRDYALEYGSRWLEADFKKQNGFLESSKLSAEYGFYRQQYCGCGWSRRERGL